MQFEREQICFLCFLLHNRVFLFNGDTVQWKAVLFWTGSFFPWCSVFWNSACLTGLTSAACCTFIMCFSTENGQPGHVAQSVDRLTWHSFEPPREGEGSNPPWCPLSCHSLRLVYPLCFLPVQKNTIGGWMLAFFKKRKNVVSFL